MDHQTSGNRRRVHPGSRFPPGSIGDLSARVGYDVRDLIMEGFTWDEIHDVASGRYSLAELRRRGPRSKGQGKMKARDSGAFHLRVSIAPLARTILYDPESGQRMLVLERKATVTDHAHPDAVQVRAQPLGGASKILDPVALRERIGHLHYDSEESAEQHDFRILIRASEWEELRQFVVHSFLHPEDGPFETDPHRELSDEMEKALGLPIDRAFYRMRAISPLIQDEATAGCAPSSGERPTKRIYHIHHVQITHAPLVKAILKQSREVTDDKLRELARKDLKPGKAKSGRANALLALPAAAVLDEIQQFPDKLRDSVLELVGREMYENVLAVLFRDLAPELRDRTSFTEFESES